MSWQARIRLARGAFVLDASIGGGTGTVALVGPNGAGKSTLLRAIAGAVRVDEAELQVAGRTLASAATSLPMEARGIGYVPQGYGLFPHLSVLDNVAFGLSVGRHRLARVERHERARAMLDDLGCGALVDRTTAALSGGEQQKVALARALVLAPDLLLLDEPLAALDVTARRSVRAFLDEHLAGRPTLLVTHDPRDLRALAEKVVVLEEGRTVQEGSVDDLARSPATPFVRELLDA